MSEQKKKMETRDIGQYLLAKDGVTKYLKLSAKPNADAPTKKLVADLIALLGGDVIYVNLFDNEFKAKYNIPDFSKGRISAPVKDGSAPASTTDSSGVNF